MKKRWKIIVGILCIALVGTACSEKNGKRWRRAADND